MEMLLVLEGPLNHFSLNFLKKKAKFFPITDLEMTRFWLELSAGVDFVIDSFVRMKGRNFYTQNAFSSYY